jgi:hypothetical protein
MSIAFFITGFARGDLMFRFTGHGIRDVSRRAMAYLELGRGSAGCFFPPLSPFACGIL